MARQSRHDATLAEIIHMATFAADNAALDGRYDTKANTISKAVRAAITCAVDNGLLLVADDAEEKLAAGVPIWAGPEGANRG